MPRKRSPEWQWLEGTRVYFKHGRYVIVDGKETPLGLKKDAPRSEVLAAWEAYQGRSEGTIRWMCEQYLESEAFLRLKPKTQREYRYLINWLCKWITPNLRVPFGDLQANQLNNKAIQSAYDAQFNPASKNVIRNRRFTVLKRVYSWAIQRLQGIDDNPVVGLRLDREHSRTRYVTHEEFNLVHAVAPASTKLLMEAVYLFRLRPGEAERIEKRPPLNPEMAVNSYVTEEGFQAIRGKGSRPGFNPWTPASRSWFERARTYSEAHSTPWLIPDARGQKIRKNARIVALNRAIEKAGVSPFTMHDLKAKAITDGETKDTHRSPKMLQVYERQARQEKPTL